jgi:hypothetical protein
MDSSSAATGGSSNDATPPLRDAAVDVAPACNPLVAQHDLAPGLHVQVCSPLEYATNPPSSGSHYGTWTAFASYDFAVPRGFWVHSMEHGAVVFSYNCPTGCADEVAEAAALIDSLPVDPLCAGSPSERRVILVPDPLLDVRWAASAWGFTLRAACFEPAAFETFYLEHHGNAPENICTSGLLFSSPADIPEGCGG